MDAFLYVHTFAMYPYMCRVVSYGLQALLDIMQTAHYENGMDPLSIDDDDFRVFFLTSPYARTLATTDGLLEAFTEDQVRKY